MVMARSLDGVVLRDVLTGRFGHPLRVFQSLGSTNAEALAWATSGAPEGALVLADHQTAGRGRWDRTWVSAPGMLLQFSLVLRPHLDVEQLGLLTTALGVACAEGIEKASGLPVTIKWPNDVTIQGRKLAGMLVETMTKSRRVEVAVCGVGINCGWRDEDLPVEIAQRATSISAAVAKLGGAQATPGREVVLAAVLAHLEETYALLEFEPARLVTRAAHRSELLGGRVRARFPDGSSLDGTAERLLADGSLQLRTADGAEHALNVAEVQQLVPDD